MTKGEFTVNNGHESVDVSSVDGINAIVAMDLSNGGQTRGRPTPDGGRVAQNSGTLTGDKTAWGVFPYRCTQCAAIGNAPADRHRLAGADVQQRDVRNRARRVGAQRQPGSYETAGSVGKLERGKQVRPRAPSCAAKVIIPTTIASRILRMSRLLTCGLDLFLV